MPETNPGTPSLIDRARVILASIVTWLVVAAMIIRRVTPVLPDARGILPVPDVPVTSREAWLERELEHARSLHP